LLKLAAERLGVDETGLILILIKATARGLALKRA
jgi:hypothetical protein